MRVRRRGCIEVGTAVDAANARQSWRFRRSLLLVLEDPRGRVGYGEASPLPGWSRDDVGACRFALEKLPEALELEPTLEGIASWVDVVPSRFPAARFALETALADLVAQQRGVSMADVLGARRERLEMRQVKVKVDGRDFDAELGRLHALRAQLGPDVPLRVDFNRTLPARGLFERLSRLEPLGLELVEEPAPVEAVAALPSAPVPIGLDESLMKDADWMALAERGLIRALVLKPTVLGGAAACLDLAERAEEAGLAVTVTHAYEGPIARAMIAALALALPGRVLAPGLSPHAGLSLWGERAMAHLDGGAVVR